MDTDIVKTVKEIIKSIQTKGDSAVLNYLKNFDGVYFKSAKDLRVTDKQIKEAVKNVSPDLKKTIKISLTTKICLNIQIKVQKNLKSHNLN